MTEVTKPKVKGISTAFFLRAASVLTFLHCIGHIIGGVFGVDAPPGTKEGAVVEAMKSNQFDVLGATRSYWDFFIGYGLTISVSELLQAVIFWLLAGFAKTEPRRIRPLIAVFLVANLGFAILAWRYFFIPPLVGDLLITLALGLAYLKAGRGERAE
ncbi:MAG: hypothetical protein JOZ08_24010 [Verrucomicrobia bacterium]|nr:hypothetical protein [Verrucomicrobiota bacterium]